MKVDFEKWTAAADFVGAFDHVKVVAVGDGALALDPTGGLPQGSDTAGLYNGGAYYYGSFTTGSRTTPMPFDWAVPSWNAETPPGTWIQAEFRVQVDGAWTKWYNLGVWTFDTGTVSRHSVNLQGDRDGYVSTDTLMLKKPAAAYEYRMTLFTLDPAVTPTVKLMSAVAMDTRATDAAFPADTRVWGTELAVPERSQMDYLPDGAGWCSPTSTSMVMAYWAAAGANPTWDQTVPTVAEKCYDYVYDGTGNWPFNTAAAAGYGLEAFVSRFQSMSQVEQWVKAGVPVVIGIAFNKGALTGAPITSTNGHLLVVRGFDGNGNVIVNDPAADRTQGEVVRIVYDRQELTDAWLGASGVVYIIHPAGHPAPASLGGGW